MFNPLPLLGMVSLKTWLIVGGVTAVIGFGGYKIHSYGNEREQAGEAKVRAEWQADVLRDSEINAKTTGNSCALPLLAAILLSTGCTPAPKRPPVPGATPSVIPPLPQSSRQPPPPSECVPTCSDGLTNERESWPPMPMPPARTASSANGTTTR
jgi:hypothetical protein